MTGRAVSSDPVALEHGVVSLASKAAGVGLEPTFRERIWADVRNLLSWSLGVTLAMVLLLAAIDHVFIAVKLIEPTDRIVNGKVVMAMIGATVVQLGAAMAAIVYAVFGARDRHDSADPHPPPAPRGLRAPRSAPAPLR